MAVGYNEKGIEAKRKVLYRNFHQISELIYLVEISRTKMKVFFLLFPNFEIPQNYLDVVLPERVACKMMADCGNSFESLIQRFYVKFDTLQIEEYHNGGRPNERRAKLFA